MSWPSSTTGVVEQVGTPADLYGRPASPWVAGFVGDANLLPGRATGAEADTVLGSFLDTHVDGVVDVLVRPEHVRITPGGTATVTLVEYYGHDSVILVKTGAGDQVRVRTMFTTLQRGDAVSVSYDGPPTAVYSAG